MPLTVNTVVPDLPWRLPFGGGVPARLGHPSVSRRRLSAAIAAIVTAIAALSVAAQPLHGITEPTADQAGVRWEVPAAPGAEKVDPGLDEASPEPARVVVQAVAGHVEEAVAAARRAGVTVGARLPYIDGFSATMPARTAHALAASPAVRAITLDREITFEEYTYDESTTASNFARTTQATTAWAAGNLGEGVGVAMIDTGTSSMNDFDGRLVFGPDLSGEGSTVDSYGHGTVMAGLIGGNGSDSAARVGGAYTGVAPKATLVSVKVAGRNGVVDVSTMLQAMHWVSAYRAQFNIRVLNISWGTPSTQSPTLDPLNYAVERLWGEGVVVVVAIGNSGPQAGTVLKPGDDPLVVTVGAFDDKQNLDPADDSVAAWSSRGPTADGLVKPDVVAPGRLLVAARSYGSYVEATYPKALAAPSYIRGSGSSEAAAVTSGVAALLLAQHPSLTPDQVKGLLKGTASRLPAVVDTAQGAGRVQLGVALAAAGTPGPASWQTPVAGGLGSIEASRAGANVDTDCEPDGVIDTIRGEIDVRCEPWVPADWTGSRWTGTAWTGETWTGSRWTGSRWTGSSWADAFWSGSRWTGGTWSGSSWAGEAWTGSRWTGSRWTGSSWAGSRWTGSRWTGQEWTSAEYDDWTSSGYDELDEGAGFLNAFWGPRPGIGQELRGEVAEGTLLRKAV